MKRTPGYLLTLLVFAFAHAAVAQQTHPAKRFQVAIFTPIYLDSAFDENMAYRHGVNFPKYINSGLEFYEGVQLAIDSLDSEGIALDVHIYDSRSAAGAVPSVIKEGGLDSADLIIGHVNAIETRLIAGAAAKKNIPFISATYPNDAGVHDNPNFIILNSTLFTHCTAMYKFIQKNYALAQVVMFRKKGAQEERLKNYFEEVTRTTASVPLKIKYVTLEDNFTTEDIKKYLTEDATTVAIAGSLDTHFGELLTQQLAALYTDYPSVVFGMPTWWDATNFSRPEYKGIEVMYTTPFYIASSHPLGSRMQQDFKTKFYSRPTDMVFRGYETLYHFAHILQLNDTNTGSSLSDKRFKVFTDFDIQPIIDPKTTTLNYFENKKIYFIKKVDGIVTGVY